MRAAKITVTTTGTAGSATGTGYSDRPLTGEVFAIHVDYSASAPNTTDITVIVEADDNHPAITLYSKANSATDAWVYPHVQGTDNAGSAISGVYQHYPITGRIKVTLADCDALTTAVTVTVWVKEL